MASGTFYDAWGPTNTTTDSVNRYHQNHLKVTWSSNDSSVTYAVNAYARSGNGSGYYYASQYGVTVTIYYSLNGGSWVSLGSASGTLNYNNNVANVNGSISIPRTEGSQTIKFKAVNTGNSLNSTTTQTSNDTISALASYSITYNANGGTGAPAKQTKYYGKTLVLSTGVPTRSNTTENGYSVTFSYPDAGIANNTVVAQNNISYSIVTTSNVVAWNTNSAGTGTTYAGGSNYTGNAALTLYAKWNSTVSLGSVSLSNPLRDGYTFQGWDTNSASTSPSISATASSFTPTANTTLYAIWKRNYNPATLTNIKIIRVTNTSSTILDEEGAVGYITVDWNKGVLETAQYQPLKLDWEIRATGLDTTTTGSITFTAGSTYTTTSFYIPNLSVNSSWNLKATITDRYDNSTSSKTTLLSPAFFTMDFLKGGHGIAFGKPASEEDAFDCGFSNGIFLPGNSNGHWHLAPNSTNGNISFEWVSY